MSSADLLLHWFTVHGSVGEGTLARACEALGERFDPLCGGAQAVRAKLRNRGRRDALEPLYRLGHVDREGGRRWRIVPPMLVWTSRDDGTIVARFYGSRWPGLRQSAEKGSARFTSDPVIRGPEVWALTGERSEIEAWACGQHPPLGTVPERGIDLLHTLPSVKELWSDYTTYQPMVTGVSWERLDASLGPGSKCRWLALTKASPALDDGLYRAKMAHGRYSWLLARRRNWIALEGGELRLVACWSEFARQSATRLQYDPAQRRLAVARCGMPLPVLLDRALRLASGRGPSYDTEHLTWIYDDIEVRRAEQAARVLGVRLEQQP